MRCRAGLLRTLIVPGDGGLTSRVANAGELVSPALISPPSPLDRLRIRGFSLLLGPERGPNLSVFVVDSRGKASVALIVDVEGYRLLGKTEPSRIQTSYQCYNEVKTIYIRRVAGQLHAFLTSFDKFGSEERASCHAYSSTRL